MKSQDVFRLNVKDLMAGQGIKVKDLSEMIGLSPSYLSLILGGGRANLSDHHKDAIALVLGTTVSDLYRPRDGTPVPQRIPSRMGGDTPGVARSGAQPPVPVGPQPHSDERAASLLLRRQRDITPFEDLLRVLGVTDNALLGAFYRELNWLSDEDVRKLGGVMRNVLISWQRQKGQARPSDQTESQQDVAGPSPVGSYPGGAASHVVMGPDHRAALWLVLYLWNLTGDVPLRLLSIATSWSKERILRTVETLLSCGIILISSGGTAAGGAEDALLRPTARPTEESEGWSDFETLSRWIPAQRKRGMLLSLARGFETCIGDAEGGLEGKTPDTAVPVPGPAHLAQLFLEGGDLGKAREWYERAAIDAFGAGTWRVAKDHLLVVSSLDSILQTPAGDRVQSIQMLVTTCLNLGETEEALIHQERNLAHWQRYGPPGDLVRGLIMAGSVCARRRDWGKALDYLDRALQLTGGDFSVQARVRIGLGDILASRGHLTRCREEYERALDLAGKAQEEAIMAHAALGLGRVFLYRRDFGKAAWYLNRALSLAEKRQAALEALVRVEMGKLRFQEGSFNLAREHLSKALAAAVAIKEEGTANTAKAWLSRCLGRAGEDYDLEQKRSLAHAAREFSAGPGDKEGMVMSLVACAEAEAALERPAEAGALFREAVMEARDSENPVLDSLACEAFSRYLKDQDDDLAEVMLERSRWVRTKMR